MNHDPFVLWDHFFLEQGCGFPTHPHRGFEAITYLFEGAIAHQDNIGNASTVTAGGAQCFTAGRGIKHSEMPAETGLTTGIQLWINLPKRLKQIEPAYQQINASEIPEQILDGHRIRQIVGSDSPLYLHTNIEYLDIHMKTKKPYTYIPATGHSGLIYIVEGEVLVNSDSLISGQALLFENIAQLQIQASSTSRIMIASGLPHSEPIRQYGPYVD